MSKPLFVTPDETSLAPRRYVVKDEEGNVLFITSLGEGEAEQSATLAAQRLGGWLQGAVKKLGKG